MTAATTVAVGGTRTVPAPDPVARDYLLLALRLDQHLPGTVVSYFGPADLKAQVDLENLRPPARLVDDAEALTERVRDEIADADRRTWLEAQVTALAAHAAGLAGRETGFAETAAVMLGLDVHPVPEAEIVGLVQRADALLPGMGALAGRLESWQAEQWVPAAAVAGAATALLPVVRERARSLWGLPDGERIDVRAVRGQPWRAFNWYDGGRRSRVDINLDRATTWPDLVHLVAHETYLGHHLEQVWREVEHVDGAGHLDASVITLDTPECLLSEGLAQVLPAVALSDRAQAEAIVRVRAAHGSGPVAERASPDDVERDVAIAAVHRALSAARINVTLMRHVDGATLASVREWLSDVAGLGEAEASRAADALDDPRRAVLGLTYPIGASLLERWIEAVPESERPGRLGRILHERLTPAAIAADIVASAEPPANERPALTSRP